MQTHRDRVVRARGLDFHLVEWGSASAPTVLFLHGITGHARTWDDEASALADRFRVLALDLRGHGDSGVPPDGDYSDLALADDVAAVADALGLARFQIVGLSLGGRTGIAFAGSHPDRVERLVVVDIGPDIAPAGRTRIFSMIGAAPERFDSVEQAMSWIRVANPRYAESKLRQRVEHGFRPLPDGGFAWKYDRALRNAARDGQQRPRADLWPLWKAIECPTLVIQGRESDILDDQIARQMVDTQPRARLAVVPEAGHTVPGDQPEAFLRLIRDFLTKA